MKYKWPKKHRKKANSCLVLKKKLTKKIESGTLENSIASLYNMTKHYKGKGLEEWQFEELFLYLVEEFLPERKIETPTLYQCSESSKCNLSIDCDHSIPHEHNEVCNKKCYNGNDEIGYCIQLNKEIENG